MDRNRLINLGIVGGIVLVALFGWVLGVSPVLDQTAAAKTQQVAMTTANDSSAARLVLMKKQYSTLPKLQAELDGLSVSIPSKADVPGYLADIDTLTAATGAHLISLTVANALAYVDPAAVAVAAAAATTTGSPSATPTPSPTASAAAGATPTDPAAATPSGPTARLVTVPVKVSASGSYAQVMAFSGALQLDARLFLVTDSQLSLDPTTKLYTININGSIYTLPPLSTQAAPTPTPTQTPAPSTTPTPSSTVSAKPSGTPTSTPTPTGTAKP